MACDIAVAQRTVPPASLTPAPHLAVEAEALCAAGFGQSLILHMAEKAARNGASIEDELLASGLDEDSYYAALARFLGLPFLAAPSAAHLADMPDLDIQLIRPEMLRLHRPRKTPLIVTVPEARRLFELAALLDSLPDARTALAITSRRAAREAVWKAGERRRVRDTVSRLFETAPHFSARVTVWGKQGFLAGLIAATLVFALALQPVLAALWLHLLLSLFYCAALLIRGAALLGPPTPPADDDPEEETALPVYTVMVALYRESAVAAQLVEALGQLDWPASRLDIKLVCEAGDSDTIAALRAANPGPAFEIVEVPALLPVTKPKALAYALNGARGEFTVIYDAEDRPHPGQLREAWRRFRSNPETLACLQAPLHIVNGRDSPCCALFALEYAALFRSLLPMLARAGLPLPLGGTSNHFRTRILREAGGWDPFNVTEDADLGLRLHRLGYRSGVISLPTLENAPARFRVWLNQRTRWYKGWMQTWLVMMRAPLGLAREIGWRASAAFHLLIGGMILSSLIHPLLILLVVNAIATFVRGDAAGGAQSLLLGLDMFNLIGSYWIVRQMGMKRMSARERADTGWRQLALPLYWLALSFAAWRALPELIRKPFFWSKTPHTPWSRETQLREN